MTQSFSNKQTVLALACALALSTLSGIAAAQSTPIAASQPTAARDSSYVFDNENAVLMTASGLCVHTSSGPAPLPGTQCDPAFVPAPVAQYVAPAPQAVVEQPAPRAAPVLAQAPAPKVVAPTPVITTPAPVAIRPPRKDRN